MSNAKEFLRKKLEKISLEIEDVEIAYEYRVTTQTHIIEIKPNSVFEHSKEYIDKEIDLENEFSDQFPGEELLFISEDSLTEIESPEFVLKPKFKFNYVLSNIIAPKIESNFKTSLDHQNQPTLPEAA